MRTIEQTVRADLAAAVSACDATVEDLTVTPPKDPAYGEWTTNVAFVLARQLRRSPQEIAELIVSRMPNGGVTSDYVATTAGAYINIALTDSAYHAVFRALHTQGAEYGAGCVSNPQRIIIEYVSANPTGPVTLGNARGGPYGDALARVLAKAGHTVSREYYINDAGNQITILGHSVLGDDHAQYAGAYIDALRKDLGVTGTENPREVGRRAAQRIIETLIKPSLEQAGITFDTWFSERSLHESGAVDAAVKALRDGGHIYEQDGAQYFRSTAFGDDKDRVFVKADGEKTYACVDVAYHRDKLSRADHLINIWGADHGGTVARLRGALEALGHTNVLDIILTQFVRVMEDGTEVKMSKRRGTYIALSDLVEDVGADVVRFLFLMQAASSHVVFDLNTARERSEKNPVYYVQYAHARLCSVLRAAEQAGITPRYDVPLTHPQERALVRTLAESEGIIARTAQDYAVHRLPHYAITIADRIHAFYAACPILRGDDAAQRGARLALTQVAQTQLAELLRLIGVRAPERM